MKTISTPIKLIPNNGTADKFVAIMGDSVIRTDEFWNKDDIESEYEFTKADGPSVAWLGDNSIGACVGAYMKGDYIIGIFNFGDEGNYERSIVDGDAFIVISDL